MNKRTVRTIIIIAIIILLLLLIAFFLAMYRFPAKAIPKTVSQPTSTSTTGTSLPNSQPSVPATSVPVKPVVPPASAATVSQGNLLKEAESFAERLGSYSNQSNYDNLTELKVVMTASLQAWADKTIAAGKSSPYSGVYQGTITHAINAETIDFDDAQGKADFLVHTQKVSVTGTSTPVTAYQDITVTFVKQNGVWLVDNAVWKK